MVFGNSVEELIAAKYNLWWYLSFSVPALVMIAGIFWHKKAVLIIAIILSLFATYILCNISVREKWGKRFELAKTDEDLEYASADGANLVFTAIAIGPFEAILYTSFWGFVGWKLWPRLKIRKEKAHHVRVDHYFNALTFGATFNPKGKVAVISTPYRHRITMLTL